MRRFRPSRWSAWLAAVVCLGWALADPRFRDAEGALATAACLPLAAAGALVLIAWIDWVRRPALAFWTALGVAGQAVALQLIDAGPQLGYQHNPALTRLASEADPLLLALVGLQTALVAVGLARRRAALSAWLGGALGGWRLAMVAAVSLLASAPVSAEAARYPGELLFAGLVQLIQLGNVLLVALAVPDDLLGRIAGRLRRLLEPGAGPGGSRRPVLDRFVAAAALWVVLVSTLFSVAAYERHPHITDEVTYLIHARFLAAGRLTAPAPPVPEAFELYLMRNDGDRWYPSTPPGWPAVLALGVLLGAPWLVNPILGGLCVVLAYGLLRELYPLATARRAVLLLCLSPWHLFMSMNFMNHVATLALALGAAWALGRARRTGALLPAAVAGGLTAAVGLIRPLDCLVLAALLTLWAVAPGSGSGRRRLRLGPLTAYVAAALVVGALALTYNRLLTGDPFEFPVMSYMNERWGAGSNRLGFGPDRGQGWELDPFPGHGPLDALVNANLNTFSIQVELLGWSIGSLLLAALALVSGAPRGADRLMLALIAAVFTAHFFYYYSGGPEFGARYWFLMIVPLLVLTARGLEWLGSRLGRDSDGKGNGATRLDAAVAALCLFALVTYLPWRAIDKYHHLWGMRPDLQQLAAANDFGRSLVLIRGDDYPDYASAAAYNPVDLRADAPIYAWDRGPEVRAALRRAYPDRVIRVVDGPTRTGRGYELAAAPPAREGSSPP